MSEQNINNAENDNHDINVNLVEDLNQEQLQQKIVDLEKDKLAAENKATENWELLLRSKADEENLRRRFRLDLENAHKYGIEKFARSMLNVVDSLERGIESSDKIESLDQKVNDTLITVINSLKEGMDLTLKMLLNNLEEFGIKMINPINEIFNPVLHEAISIQKQTEDITDNSIINVVQKGFMIYDRVLRPAKVIVAKRS